MRVSGREGVRNVVNVVVFVQTGGQNLALDNCVVYIYINSLSVISSAATREGGEKINRRERKEGGRKEEDNTYTR